MRKTANIFLLVGKIFGLVMAVVFAILLIVNVVAGFKLLAEPLGDEDKAYVIGLIIGYFIAYAILISLSVVGFVLTSVADKKLRNAKSKAEAKKPAIMAIIAGVLFTGFPVVSGILYLAMHENLLAPEQLENSETKVEE